MTKLKEECAVYGVCGYHNAVNPVVEGLYSLQHRGQEGSGIAVVAPDSQLIVVKKPGLVSDSYGELERRKLAGKVAIGHTRYSTAGGLSLLNPHPFVVNNPPLAGCWNGNIPRPTYDYWRDYLKDKWCDFDTENDGELLVRLLAHRLYSGDDMVAAVRWLFQNVTGAYSGLLLHDGKMYAVRDPLGYRPLVFGDRGKSWVVSSETVGLDIIKARHHQEVQPGELVEFAVGQKPIHYQLAQSDLRRFCIFELIYFARPDSVVFNIPVGHGFRRALGKRMYHQYGCDLDIDVVIPVPDSANDFALGYHEASGVPLGFGLRRNHYVGRTFIEPKKKRAPKVRRKLNPDRAVIAGKRVLIIDDSIVRSTTMLKIVRMLRRNGAKEVHVLIGSPLITHSCYFGVDTPDRDELVAAQNDVDGIRRLIEADTLQYVTIQDLRSTVLDLGAKPDHFCGACFSGDYHPTPVPG